MWRGTSQAKPIRTGASFVLVGKLEQRFVCYPISEPDPQTGLATINWIAELTYDTAQAWGDGDWNTKVPIDKFVHEFADWSFDWLSTFQNSSKAPQRCTSIRWLIETHFQLGSINAVSSSATQLMSCIQWVLMALARQSSTLFYWAPNFFATASNRRLCLHTRQQR